MLTVGTDTYITVEEADSIINGRYVSGDPNRERWEKLNEEDKEVFLRHACTLIEKAPLRGQKYRSDQTLQFPRVRYGEKIPPIEYPSEVKTVQAELALWLSDTTLQAERSKRLQLQAQGIRSVSMGSASESYTDMGIRSTLDVFPYRGLLANWLNGGYEVV